MKLVCVQFRGKIKLSVSVLVSGNSRENRYTIIILYAYKLNRISKKANNTLGFLWRNIKIHSESLKSSAYKVPVRPQLEYCSTVWCPFTDSNISKLEAIQRRAARWVKHDYGQTSSVTEIMQSLHWCRLDQRRIDHKLSHNLIAIPISDFLIPLVRPSRHYHPLSYS